MDPNTNTQQEPNNSVILSQEVIGESEESPKSNKWLLTGVLVTLSLASIVFLAYWIFNGLFKMPDTSDIDDLIAEIELFVNDGDLERMIDVDFIESEGENYFASNNEPEVDLDNMLNNYDSEVDAIMNSLDFNFNDPNL
jgi:hypothetical protein